MDRETLQAHIHEGIPLSRFIKFEVRELGQQHIEVFAAQQPNINVHGTAFAGSLQVICTLAAWGLVYSRLPEGTALVMVDAQIRYRRPVVGNISASAEVDETTLQQFLNGLSENQKSRITVEVAVMQDEQVAVRFETRLHAAL